MRKALASDWDVDCPLCHAMAGEYCRNIGQGGRFENTVHRERRRAAEAARRGV